MTPIEATHPNTVFFTERLQLAIYLHATDKLSFLRCEPSESGRLRFVFDDPGGIAPDLELAFDRGATVNACSLFGSQKFLRRQMSAVLEPSRISNYEKHLYL
jgi:hypothetical protein